MTVVAQEPRDGASAGDGGGAKMRKASGVRLPLFKLASADGPMVPRTQEAAVQLPPMAQEDIDQAIQIVEAHRLATARTNRIGPHTKAMITKALGEGHSQQFILETMNRTY